MSSQIAPEGFTPEVCLRCDGSKRERNGKPCMGCKGRGFVNVRKPVTECAYCHGTTNAADGISPCSICGGSGWANTWRG